MIKHFGSLYAGHVDLGDLGLGATAVNERRFDNDHLSTIFNRVEQIVKVMDDLNYHSFWAAEHHFQHEGNEVIPNLLLLYVHLAHMTKNLKFGCGFNINPMWHPLRLAEDYATADILTNGRVIFGVGPALMARSKTPSIRTPKGSMRSPPRSTRSVAYDCIKIIRSFRYSEPSEVHRKPICTRGANPSR